MSAPALPSITTAITCGCGSSHCGSRLGPREDPAALQTYDEDCRRPESARLIQISAWQFLYILRGRKGSVRRRMIFLRWPRKPCAVSDDSYLGAFPGAPNRIVNTESAIGTLTSSFCRRVTWASSSPVVCSTIYGNKTPCTGR